MILHKKSKKQIDSPIINLLQSEEWPEAVPAVLICEDTEEDKTERAEGILSLLDENIENKKFLDFGCGEGHVAMKASELSSISIGYDICQTGQLAWEGNDKFILTSDFSKVEKYSPFDVVLLYDVLDHCQSPTEVLNLVKSVCNSSSRIHVRCHSWMSRHGGHLYKTLNKAWAHLLLTEEELEFLNVKLPFLQKYFFPIDNQKKWFYDSGFNVLQEDIISSEVESFFTNNKKLVSRMLEITNKSFKKFPKWQMSQDFNDYILNVK